MLTVDISLPDIDELHKLVTEGQEKGFLSYDEIVAGLEEVDLTKEQVEDFYTYLIDHGIELVEGVEHKAPPHEQPALAEEEKAGPKLDLTVEPSLDSLRLYLREIGKVPLLTADQEVYLAKRIERGDMNVLHFGGDLTGSLAVFVGLLAARAGYPEGDAIAALFVSVLVLTAATRLIQGNVDVLMASLGPRRERRRARRSLESRRRCLCRGPLPRRRGCSRRSLPRCLRLQPRPVVRGRGSGPRGRLRLGGRGRLHRLAGGLPARPAAAADR